MLATQEVTLKVKFPQSLLFDYGLTEKEAGAEMLRAFVLSLYRHDKISTGKAARLLGMRRLDFIRLLADEGIPYLDYTSEELDADVQTLRDLLLKAPTLTDEEIREYEKVGEWEGK